MKYCFVITLLISASFISQSFGAHLYSSSDCSKCFAETCKFGSSCFKTDCLNDECTETCSNCMSSEECTKLGDSLYIIDYCYSDCEL